MRIAAPIRSCLRISAFLFIALTYAAIQSRPAGGIELGVCGRIFGRRNVEPLLQPGLHRLGSLRVSRQQIVLLLRALVGEGARAEVLVDAELLALLDLLLLLLRLKTNQMSLTMSNSRISTWGWKLMKQ